MPDHLPLGPVIVGYRWEMGRPCPCLAVEPGAAHEGPLGLGLRTSTGPVASGGFADGMKMSAVHVTTVLASSKCFTMLPCFSDPQEGTQ